VKLIVGLGNPGYEYHLTPHNLGFMAVDRLAEECGVDISRREGQALVARSELQGVEVVLAKPQTFMNLSGLAVERLFARYDVTVRDLIVLLDEADLPFGMLRIRQRGSAGGHNGMKSIIGALQSDEFARVRMGIQPVDRPVEDRATYVLSRFRKSEMDAVEDLVDRAAEAVRVILRDGTQKAMNLFNRRDQPAEL
jgi:PTH1 family peptidyl-tRNA hydrolase